MKQLIWRLQYAYLIWKIAALPIRQGWQCSEDAWKDNSDWPCAPRSAVMDELSYWTE